ncbi:flagellar P-ring protein FlgI [Shewanella mangrovi]|uniref:Flagellar P-ring protein n=1 Tax=Shewanella mangrovi TaxID=1515746 RepID=A0A094JE40_9GAMM|nr:flagellar basal body P-ring protein FlgI [Shewanella mangrovi]KFZ38195.1 flagellar P-ring protein FlgI [Shewanella mangrovi]
MCSRFLAFFALLLTLISPLTQASSRALLDLVDVQGTRENQLVGYGLVVGLAGTGDKSQIHFAGQSLNNMLKQFGVKMDEGDLPRTKNIAAVSVQATLPPNASPGQTIDVTISSLGDAKSLLGGSLVLTPLRGVDGKVYALAQGNLVVGGVNASGSTGSSITVNVPTAGIIPNGATVEREILSRSSRVGEVVLNLKTPNYKTARNIVNAINKLFGAGVANAENWGKLVVSAPKDPNDFNTFMSMLQDVQVEQGSQRPKVIFNSRSGTVVINEVVRVHKAAVTHGSLTITVTERQGAIQPAPFSNGTTVPVNSSDVSIEQQKHNMMVFPDGTSLETIVQAINSLGATPSELMSILIALDKAGSLEADLIVI